jgi:hypothetical protein
LIVTAYGELDPKDPLNIVITDIQFAPRNARGMVEYSATFTLAKPMDLTKASGVLIYDVANRGRAPLASGSSDAGALTGDTLLVTSPRNQLNLSLWTRTIVNYLRRSKRHGTTALRRNSMK